VSTRLYRIALLAFPRSQREMYAAEMIDAFERELACRKGIGSIQFVLAACLNTVSSGVVERRRHRVRRLGYAFSTLDFTLAWRMLLRYPGLSLVSVFGMAIAIAVAAGASTVVAALMDTRLPLPEGERIVSFLNIDVSTNNEEFRLLRDFQEWRSLSLIEDLGMSHSTSKNLIVEGRVPEPITVAEISVSAFRVARVAALRGRHLLEADALPDAEPAILIGHDEWVRRFGADPDIVGRPVQLGGVTYTIVGVMPEGFAFPVSHSFWIPWRLDGAAYQPRSGPTVTMFGRLAPGATLESAQAELTAIGNRTAADWPATHQHLRPRVVPYTHAFTDMSDPENVLSMRAMQMAMVLLLVLVCVNVAILVYARTATRQGEIAVRGALGASRGRIVAQLFVEALTLAGVAATLGVVIVATAMPQLEAASIAVTGGRLPFWMSLGLNTRSVATIVALTLLSAAIVGVLPALKATGRDVHTRLQTLSPGSGSRMQMGRLWTLLIVGQVGCTVALLPAVMIHTWDALRLRTGDAGFASREFVSVTLAMEGSPPSAPPDAAAFALRYGTAHRELEERLRQQPGVIDVTYGVADAGQELAMVLEADGQPNPDDPVDYNIVEGRKSGHFVRYNRVAINFFDAFDVPIMLGRGFTAADAGANHVLISHTAGRTVFGDANPLGRRIKYVGRSREATADATPLDRWYEIVGVVADFPANDIESTPRIYHPAAYGEVQPARVGVRVRASDPASFSSTLRDVTAKVNANLQVRNLSTAAILVQREQGMFRMIGVTVGLVITSVIALSAAGIYALMSFTVARRRREIGIRAALGANRNRLLAGIFGRVIVQLSAGAAVGLLAAVGLEQVLEGNLLQQRGAAVLPLVALVMMTVGIIAAWGPAREGLAIQPTDALREE
jgi:predicted permease